MPYRFLVALLACLSFTSCSTAENDSKTRDMTETTKTMPSTSADTQAMQKDLDALQGTWEIVSAQQSGVDATKACQEHTPKITFQGDVWLQDIDNHPLYTAENSHIKVDPSKSPKQMDHFLTRVIGGQPASVSYPGIYEIDGDSLKLCWDIGLKQRPTKFASQTDEDFFFVALKRVKAGDK